MANPPKYDPEVYMPELLRRVGNGELLVDLYGKDGFPSNYTVHGELTRTDGRWANAYTRAREQQAHAIAEKAVRDVEKTIDPEQAQLARLKFDARRRTRLPCRNRRRGSALLLAAVRPAAVEVDPLGARQVEPSPQGADRRAEGGGGVGLRLAGGAGIAGLGMVSDQLQSFQGLHQQQR